LLRFIWQVILVRKELLCPKLLQMRTLEKTLEERIQLRIEDYVAGRMNPSDRQDFECDMEVDYELQKDVARVYLRKLHLERKVKQHIEQMNRSQFLENQLSVCKSKTNDKCSSSNWWSKVKTKFNLKVA
jgi:anti-sigma-K factor RskA